MSATAVAALQQELLVSFDFFPFFGSMQGKQEAAFTFTPNSIFLKKFNFQILILFFLLDPIFAQTYVHSSGLAFLGVAPHGFYWY